MSRIPSTLRRHPIALLALFVALGGTSYAAVKLPKNSVGAKQIKKNAVTSKKVKNGSLRAADFKAGELPSAGTQGPKGDAGARGPAGPTGPAGSDAEFDGAAAGGDLTGTYPDPAIAAGAVGTGELAEAPGIRLTAPVMTDHTFEGTCETALEQAPSSGGEQILKFDAQQDLGSGQVAYSCVENNTFATIEVAGVYQITLNVMWAASDSGFRAAGIKAGTFAPYAAESRIDATDGTQTAQSVSATVDLDPGDIVQPYVIQNSGNPLGFITDGRTNMTIRWIGN